mmetsp:Transcript_19834/g.32594  ORF Transcript_19834/g.32594 Transcript_19834/m.32594 type:complete len:337 (+) Transcript_19834:160-1170(+)|eukprot:CAMPEP_0203751632 /NCGR_PEP_ID=MMETSP0098-20131031/5671_1 /ASSEMBLY_ACC=CAM_ASM_000208 /TAXON_ID=96639 /ORGANISM=" , Strain NY0313808BC1" /LENGTH=336 /DNA_ID=CAMNT_0050641439 /DNA_START=142 /DNA_END=1152 /DNA_ORIENTATION=-
MGTNQSKGWELLPDYIKECGAELGVMENSDGLKLAKYVWKNSTEDAKGLIILCHGVSSHVCYDYLNVLDTPTPGSYEGSTSHDPEYKGSYVEKFNQMGYVVAGIDHQSYGRSEGSGGRDHWFNKFDDLVDDQIQFRKEMCKEYPDLPVFLMGLSMGGCVVTRVAEVDNSFDYAGAVLFAPMLLLETLKQQWLNRVLLPLSSVANAVIPTARLASKAPHVNAEMDHHFSSDVLCESGNTRVNVAMECLAATDEARENADKVKCPLLIFHSVHDTMTDLGGSEYLYKHASSSDKCMENLLDENMWHALVHEPGYEKLLAKIVDWLSERNKNAVHVVLK